MEENEADVEFKRGELTRKLNAGEDVVIQSDRAAVLRNVTCPKSQYHFIVLPKEEIENVIALKRDHLSLLEHMMDLANDVIEQQQLPSADFLIGFKLNAFMNRLNMHVISKDFYSSSMRRIQHWNTFNTDLFITFQATYALLRMKGFIEPMAAEKVEQLLVATPVHCNQCTFRTENFGKFKHHLYLHWRKRENERHWKIAVANISQSMGTMQINRNGGTMWRPPFNSFYRQMMPMHQNRNLNNFQPKYRHPAPPKHPNESPKTQADAASKADPNSGTEHQPKAKKKWYVKKKKNSQNS